MKQDIFPAQTKTKLKSSHNSRAPLSPVCKKRFSRLIPLNRRYSAGKQAFVSEGVSKYKILFIPGLNTCIPIKTVVKPSKPFVFNICIFRHCLGNVEIQSQTFMHKEMSVLFVLLIDYPLLNLFMLKYQQMNYYTEMSTDEFTFMLKYYC